MNITQRVSGSDVKISIWCYDIFDDEWGWYWTVYSGDLRVNGGVAYDDYDAKHRAQIAIASWDADNFRKNHIYDVETHSWYNRDGTRFLRWD